MATIKSFTSLEQSKKLAEFLPLESADMCWEVIYASPKDDIIEYADKPTIGYIKHCLPAWSLAALLDILPKIHGAKPILDLEENSIQYTGIDLYVVADNPVDACVAMIEKLHELKKHYLDTNNNYRCELKKYPESNIIRGNWGQWEVDADKCNNYKVK